MQVMFTISAFGPEAKEAEALREILEGAVNQSGLIGKTNGMGHENFASYCGHYRSNDKDDGCDNDKHGHKEQKD